MVVAWPSDRLPLDIDVSSFSLSRPDGRLRSPMSQGPAKVRRATSAAPMPVAVSLTLDTDQAALLEHFYEVNLNGGIEPFTLPDKRYDGQPLLDSSGNPLLDGSGNPLLISASWLARIADATPQQSAVSGTVYRYSLQLEILP
jgi:hypothetical protein